MEFGFLDHGFWITGELGEELLHLLVGGGIDIEIGFMRPRPGIRGRSSSPGMSGARRRDLFPDFASLNPGYGLRAPSTPPADSPGQGPQ
jgi:hypothetical protein